MTTESVWPGGTDAAAALFRSPPSIDIIAESRTDFVWFYVPSTPCSSKLLLLQNETIPKTILPQMQGNSWQNASASQRQRMYPFEICT